MKQNEYICFDNQYFKIMESRKKLITLAILFIITIGNYSRNTSEVKSVAFLSIFALGAITALFVREIIVTLKNR